MDTLDKIAVLDFGGQYTQLIARSIRDLGVYSEIFPCTHLPTDLLTGGYKGIVLSGGPNSVYDTAAPLPSPALFEKIGNRFRRVALEDGLTIDDTVSDRAVSKGIAFDKTCAYFRARTKLLFCHINTPLFLVEIRLLYLSDEN